MSVALHPRVLELIASKICHDMVSPVGAISNGVELMEELGESAEALSLISSSAEQASIRLKCFRLAYGGAGTDKNIGFKEIIDAFTDWIKAGNVNVKFDDDLSLKFSMPPKGFLKVLLNLLMLVTECSKGEGEIHVSALEGNKGVKILTTGSNIGFREGVEEALVGESNPEELDARSVHSYLAGQFAKHFDLKIEHNLSEGSDALEVSLSF